MRVFLFVCMASALSAQVLRVEQAFGGMECASCADFIKNKIGKNAGVASVEVDAKKGAVVVDLKPDSTVKPQLIRDWVQQSGYTIKETTFTVRGVVMMNRGVMSLRVAPNYDLVLLDHEFLLREQFTKKVEIVGVLEKAKLGGESIDAVGVKKLVTKK